LDTVWIIMSIRVKWNGGLVCEWWLLTSSSCNKYVSFIYLQQRRRYMRLPAMFVCLSVCEQDYSKRVHGFGWNFACWQMSGHGRTGQLLSPIRIIVRMPEPENLKDEDLSKSVKQSPHSEQATGHGMHCREILFTQRCSPRARKFPGSVDFSVRRTVVERQSCPIFRFWPLSEVHALHRVPF